MTAAELRDLLASGASVSGAGGKLVIGGAPAPKVQKNRPAGKGRVRKVLATAYGHCSRCAAERSLYPGGWPGELCCRLCLSP